MVDAGRLWAGGAATALVAALVAVVGVVIGDAVFDVEMVAATAADRRLARCGTRSPPPLWQWSPPPWLTSWR